MEHRRQAELERELSARPEQRRVHLPIASRYPHMPIAGGPRGDNCCTQRSTSIDYYVLAMQSCRTRTRNKSPTHPLTCPMPPAALELRADFFKVISSEHFMRVSS